MAFWNWDKIWQGLMAVALPIAMGAVAADPPLKEALLGLWEDLTPSRALFFLSVAVLCVGLTRNSARLRQLQQKTDSGSEHQIRPSQRASEQRGPRGSGTSTMSSSCDSL